MMCRICDGSGKVAVQDSTTGFYYSSVCAGCRGTGESFLKPDKRKRRARVNPKQRPLFPEKVHA